MVVLESCPKHNMVAYLEKTDGNAKFHDIIYFLTRSSIHHALTVSDQAKEIQKLKAQIKKLKKQAKPGRNSAKGEPTVHKDPLFDEILEDSLDYMETEDAQDEGRTRDVVDKEKENAEDVLIMKRLIPDMQKVVSIEQNESPLKIDPKDKVEKKIEEEDESKSESDGILEAEKKFKQLASDEEMARKARIEADRLLAEKFQKKKRAITTKKKAKFLHDTMLVSQEKSMLTKIHKLTGTDHLQRIN
ncbi:hypothetical protein Tco_0849666 [Tanacetum coccineum]